MAERIATRVPGFMIRQAGPDDVPLLLELIRGLAEYEMLAHEVEADAAKLGEALFGARRAAEALIGELDGKPAAFAVFFHNFSTFLGRPGLYLEDLFVKPEYRGRGLGKAMLERLAAIARERDCGRFEWWVLDWNTPAIEFYKRLGAVPMDEWTVFRVAGPALTALAEGASTRAVPASAREEDLRDGIVVRRATLDDVDALAPLFDAYRRHYAQPSDIVACGDFLRARLERGEAVIYGAWRSDAAVGFVQLYPSWSSVRLARIWVLNDLYVGESARGQGIGERLLRAAAALARATGAAYLALETTPDNARAQRLYEKLGWTRDPNLHYLKLPVDRD